MYLTSPARVVFDLPNTISNPNVINQDIKIGQDVIKIGQFSSNKTRIVITSNQLEKYLPIFSSDGQSILFTNTEIIDPEVLFSKTTDAVAYEVRQLKQGTEEFLISFNSPVVHSVRRDSSKLTVTLYNALRYSDKNFRNAVATTGLRDMKIDLLPQVGLKITLPLEKEASVKCFLGSNGKSIKIAVTGTKERLKPKPAVVSEPQRIIILPKGNGHKSVVIDAGHGGSDYGAIRSGINEKDINLDVSKRVQAILASHGVTAYMSRDKDEFVSLQDRTIYSANKSADIFVSIHVNSALATEATGLETHYYHPESLELAQTVHSSLVSYVKSKDRGLFKSRFYVINHTKVPAILVEIGFLSNAEERAELVSEQRKSQTAKAISEGILKYLNKK